MWIGIFQQSNIVLTESIIRQVVIGWWCISSIIIPDVVCVCVCVCVCPSIYILSRSHNYYIYIPKM